MNVADTVQASVPLPSVGMNRTPRLYAFPNGIFQAFCRGIRNPSKPYTTYAGPLYLCNNNYQSLSSRTAAPLSGLFASDIRLINFHHTRNAVSPRTYHCTAEFVQPSPGSIIATQAENLLQAQRTGTSFLAF